MHCYDYFCGRITGEFSFIKNEKRLNTLTILADSNLRYAAVGLVTFSTRIIVFI